MKSFLIPLFLIFTIISRANNIMVSNISLTDQDIVQNTIMINFDLSWENSWRVSAGPANWDAAWIFAKYRTAAGTWQHVELNLTGHVAPSGVEIKVTSDGVGCHVYRDSDGSGHNFFSGIKLLWDYGLESLDDDAAIEIKLFAIEMVYVPKNAFSIGTTDLGPENSSFYTYGTSNPYFINSEDPIEVGTNPGDLYYYAGGDQSGPIPSSFPKGFNAFYCMKYEVSQAQWVAFFNTLTDIQKANNDITDVNHKNSDGIVERNAISWVSGFASTSLPDVPLNYIRMNELKAYLDWAGLRPMTELEYEKACRGPLAPIPGEFAWGNTEIPNYTYSIINQGLPNELVSNPTAEQATVAYSGTQQLNGPLRCGIASASAINKTRTESGGSYYGIMELTGNLYERCIPVGTSENRAFTGLHGNGELTVSGDSDVPNWPSDSTPNIAFRGGGYWNGATLCMVSDRLLSYESDNTILAPQGFRGVRTE